MVEQKTMLNALPAADSGQPMRLAPTPSRAPHRSAVLRACVAATLFVAASTAGPSLADAQHGIAMHGNPALLKDFRALPYVNPDAPKGGRLVQGLLGTFDSLNPLIVKGLTLPQLRSYVIESLLTRNYDEPF